MGWRGVSREKVSSVGDSSIVLLWRIESVGFGLSLEYGQNF